MNADLEAFRRSAEDLTPFWMRLICTPFLEVCFLSVCVQKKKPTAAGLDGWGWRELKSLRLAWFDKLAKIRTLVEVSGVWPDGILDAYIAMIPEVDGDATLFGQRPLCVLPIV